MTRFTYAAAALALALPAAAHAQDDVEVGEIVVTGALNTAREDIAQGVVVLDRTETLEAPIGGLGETLDEQPGIASTFFGAGASRPIIRGLGEDRVRILTNGVGVIDVSAVSPDHAVTTEGLEAERIEVLRGPAALLYGGNAIGGVVNVIDGLIAEERPEKPFAAQAYAGIASGLESAAGAGSVTMATGALVARVDAFTRSSDDFEIPGFADAHAEEEIAEGHDPAEFAFGVAPNSFTEADSASLGLSLVGDDGFIGAAVRRYETQYGIPEGSHEHEEGEEEEEEEGEEIFAGPRIDMKQTRWDIRGGTERDFGIFDGVMLAGSIADYQHAEIEPSGEVGTLFTSEGWEARGEITHRDFSGLTGVWGFDAFSRDFAAVGEEAFITPTTTDEIGLFAVERYERGPFAVEGGAHVDRRTIDNETSGEREFDLVSASLAGSWRPIAPLFLGVTIARTERAPTETELFAFGPHLATGSFEIGDPSLDKEIATTAEIAARWRNDRFSVEASLYRADFKDYIALVPTGDEEDELPVFLFVQRDAEFTGGEIEAGLTIADTGFVTFSADAAYDWVRAEFDEGGDLPRIPPNTLTLGLEAETGFVDARLEWVDVDGQDHVAEFETPTDGYGLWNAQLTFRPVRDSDRLVFLLDGRNLADEEARVHTSFVKDLVPRPGRSVRFAILGRF